MPNFSLEQRYGTQGWVCGIDEVGRGPWAGPVVATAVIIPNLSALPDGINDSKKLSKKKREALNTALLACCYVGMGEASPAEIDERNILAASLLAMSRAFDALEEALSALPSAKPITAALVDGNKAPALPLPTKDIHCIVKGDSQSLSIAAASIIAKVARDAQMTAHGITYPEYGFEKHSGYGTKQHQEALAAHGITPIHRKSFRPIAKLCA